jgi:hypothetical protein
MWRVLTFPRLEVSEIAEVIPPATQKHCCLREMQGREKKVALLKQ